MAVQADVTIELADGSPTRIEIGEQATAVNSAADGFGSFRFGRLRFGRSTTFTDVMRSDALRIELGEG